MAETGESGLRVVELYCGIGGCAAALAGMPAPFGTAARVTLACDISAPAIAVYRHNFPRHAAEVRLIDTLPAARLRALDADLFWLSPPCQPFTRRGHERHLDDPRAQTFLAALGLIEACRPPFVALENVVGFERSAGRERLLEVLAAAGYAAVQERLLCPSELGWPNRRPRYYLVAAQGTLGAPQSPRQERVLAEFLDPEPAPGLELDRELAARFAFALHQVDATGPAALTSCFTSAYGRSPVRAGSYLVLPGGGLRLFSPQEILRLLGFPRDFTFPASLSRRQAYKLAGNSLSLPAVQAVLASLPAAR